MNLWNPRPPPSNPVQAEPQACAHSVSTHDLAVWPVMLCDFQVPFFQCSLTAVAEGHHNKMPLMTIIGIFGAGPTTTLVIGRLRSAQSTYPLHIQAKEET